MPRNMMHRDYAACNIIPLFDVPFVYMWDDMLYLLDPSDSNRMKAFKVVD